MKVVNQPLRKKDAMQLVTGQPVYVDDVTPRDCLCVKLLRSPHANAIVKSINKTAAMKVPGMEAIFTWEDVDQDGRRYTQAGQTYPEASPYDRLVIDRKYNRIEAVTGFPKGLPAPQPESEILVFDADEPDMEVFGKLPEWVQDIIRKSTQFADNAPEEKVDIPPEEPETPPDSKGACPI